MSCDTMNFLEKQNKSRIAALLTVLVVPVICLIPFATKAFHMDDTLFLWCARQIHISPFDFFGFAANWYGFERPMFEININPPLVSYFIALVAYLFGWNEVALHLAFLIPAVFFSLGTYRLAKHFCEMPCLAAITAVLTPSFLVSATNVMSDVPMLALYVWALVFWLAGLERNCHSCLLLASILITLASLTKYFGITLIPLILVYSLVVKRGMGSWAAFLCIPIVVILAYDYFTYIHYGYALIYNAVVYPIVYSSVEKYGLFAKALAGLSFTGGCLVAVAFYAPLLWPRRILAAGGLTFLLIVAVLVCMGSVGSLSLREAGVVQWGLLIQLAFFVLAGMHVLALASADLVRSRDAASLFLFLWICGTFAFTSFCNWSTNGRTVLPMAPAAAILVMRRLDRRLQVDQSPTKLGWRTALPLIPAACVALAVTWADFRLANCQRAVANEIFSSTKDSGGTLLFEGHWGFQYYMELLGGKAMDYEKYSPKVGDLIVVLTNNSNVRLPDKDKVALVKKWKCTPCPVLASMDLSVGAGFDSDFFGPLPYAIGRVGPGEYLLLSVRAL